MTKCVPCVSIDCYFPSDLGLYSLDGLQFFLNPRFYPVIFCPPNYDCKPGPGANQQTVSVNCCGQVLSAIIYNTMTDAEVAATLQGLQQQCIQYAGKCGAGPTGPGGGPLPYPNQPKPGPGTPTTPIPPTPSPSLNTLKALNPFVCLGTPLLSNLIYTISGPDQSANWTFSANTPAGITLTRVSFNSAAISGTPTTAGNFPFTVSAVLTGAPQITAQVNDSLSVMSISGGTPEADSYCDSGTGLRQPDASATVLYTTNLTAAGGTAPYTFKADPATIPSWLTVASDGTISGTPQLSDVGIDFTFEVTATDSNNHTCGQCVIIQVGCGLICSSPSGTCPPNGTVCTFYTCTFSSVPSPVGTVYSGSLPGGLSIDPATGIVSGYPSTHGTGVFVITATLPDSSTCTGTFTNTIASDGTGIAKSVQDLGTWTNVLAQNALPNPASITGAPVQGSFTITVDVPMESNSGTFRYIWNQTLGRCASHSAYNLNVTANCTFNTGGTANILQNIGVTVAGTVINSGAIGSGTGFSINNPAVAVPASPTPPNCVIDLQINANGMGNTLPVSCVLTILITPNIPP